jgi:hypothetical protein
MGIRLDWEIEAEQEHHQQSGGEDPENRRRRWQARTRFLIALFVMLGLIGGVVGLVELRLRQVEDQIEQVVSDTATAEVAALRLGDREAYLDMQRSATTEWVQQQDANFAHYQALKQTSDVNLSGRIISVQVDGARARVQIEEIIGGIPYGHAWFYWRYDDGWRHVPPDYTFWGDAQSAQADNVLVKYDTVDMSEGLAIAPRVSDWLKIGCAALGCSTTPHFTVEIVPNPTQEIAWSSSEADTLEIPSPYITAARLDEPFDSDTQIKVATLIAERLVGDFNPTYPSDAYYLRQAIVSWLVKRFAEVETNSFLVSSLATTYGDTSVGQLLQALQPTSNIGILSQVTGKSLDAASLDWSDFLTWRLTVENELITRQDQTNFLELYDPSMRDQAIARYNVGGSADQRIVNSAIPEQVNATAQLRALVQVGNPATSQEEVVFRLLDGVWKRAS